MRIPTLIQFAAVVVSAGACGAGGSNAREPGGATTAKTEELPERCRDPLREAVAFEHSLEEEAWREPYRATARSELGEDSWEEALAQGRAMSMEEAIEYALSEEEPSATTSSTTRYSPLSSAPELPAGLTPREVEVSGLVAEGLTNAQIAERLFVSPRTVYRHLNSIYRKLGVNSRAAAIRFALERGLT